MSHHTTSQMISNNFLNTVSKNRLEAAPEAYPRLFSVRFSSNILRKLFNED